MTLEEDQLPKSPSGELSNMGSLLAERQTEFKVRYDEMEGEIDQLREKIISQSI